MTELLKCLSKVVAEYYAKNQSQRPHLAMAGKFSEAQFRAATNDFTGKLKQYAENVTELAAGIKRLIGLHDMLCRILKEAEDEQLTHPRMYRKLQEYLDRLYRSCSEVPDQEDETSLRLFLAVGVIVDAYDWFRNHTISTENWRHIERESWSLYQLGWSKPVMSWKESELAQVVQNIRKTAG